MHRTRVYVDTSVIGGCFDEEFAEDSLALFAMVRAGNATLLVSDTLARELDGAPEHVRDVVTSLPPEALEPVEADKEALDLQQQYVAAGVVTEAAARDALHVPTATVARADVIVSWNFRHIVHYDTIRGFNAVNYRAGYPMIAIHTPTEVV